MSIATSMSASNARHVGPDALEKASRALGAFRRRRDDELAASARALARFREQGLHRFDLFRIAAVRVNENQFTEALVALFDAGGAHGLGNAAFLAFLSALTGPVAERIEEEVRRGVRYRAWTQHVADETTPDALVLADSFVVLLEHKVRGGYETVSKDGRKQTVRQAQVLAEICAANRIRTDAALGVLLSPEGTVPAAGSFQSLRTSTLLARLRSTVGERDGTAKIVAFLDMWEEFNA